MTTDSPRQGGLPPSETDSEGRAQLSNLYGVFVLSSLMFDGRGADLILQLAANSVSSLGRCHTEATYRVLNGSLTDGRDPDRALDGKLDSVVVANLGVDQAIRLPDGRWRYAITLRAVKGITGVLVVGGTNAASPDELFLLKVLAQQTAAAMTSADLLEKERAQRMQLHDLTEERTQTINRLTRTVAELERQDRIHNALTAVSGSGADEAGIADALHELTSLEVIVEDIFGNARAWSGGPEPTNYRPIGGDNREDVLRHAAASGKPERDGDRLFCVVRPKADVLGVLLLQDPNRDADRLDTFALEYAATVLALELSHQRNLAETELRLRRDLVEDLLAGTDDASAYSRAEALGHNLRIPHTVTVLQWNRGVDSDVVARSARVWASSVRLHPLTARRPTMTILLTDGVPQPSLLHRAVSADIGSDLGSVGIGSAATVPSELPRSFSEAQRALKVQKASVSPYGTRRYDDLGVYRILDPGDSRPEVRGFVWEWLGALVTYDRRKRTDLVKTLTRYLDTGGNYDQTAHLLNIHRSTLRYRLRRIRDISGRDLQDVDTRLNLHLATRVYDVIGASESATEGDLHA
jgi:sugar diacid utilization regulator